MFYCFLDVAVNCGTLASPSNGWIQKKTGETFGALHIFMCNVAEGYLMRGSKERRCLANASWSGVQPICYRKFSDHNLYATFISHFRLYRCAIQKKSSTVNKESLQQNYFFYHSTNL